MTRGVSINWPARPDRVDRFRRAEAAVWRRHGLVPTERVFDIAEPSIRLRALEVGRGRPILLVHGTVGPAAWPSLIEAMGGDGRFIVLDRPGWGGSDAVDFGRSADDHRLAADVLGSALDALGIEQAVVIGGSIGNVWALSLAQHRPSRVSRVVMLGAGPLRADVRPPRFIRILASPIGRLIVRLPMSADRTRSILAASGHASSLADGRIPDELVDYRVSLSNDTHAMRHERTMVSHLVRGSGWRPGLPFDDKALAGIGAPTLFVYGTNDDVGDVPMWRCFVAAMPHAELEIVEGAGHMPWFDRPRDVAERIDRFLAAEV
jgi:pimeloyl-ACP methyl ester carboxylesterase